MGFNEQRENPYLCKLSFNTHTHDNTHIDSLTCEGTHTHIRTQTVMCPCGQCWIEVLNNSCRICLMSVKVHVCVCACKRSVEKKIKGGCNLSDH